MKLVLGSKSPRRADVLRAAGIAFVLRPGDAVEEHRPGESPEDYVRRLAREKAEAIEVRDGETILTADTVVVAGGEILEKPRDPGDAARMLRLLAGAEHQVITGICLRGGGREIVDLCRTRVFFVPLTDAEIDDYVATGESMDKAGAYGAQALASKFIDRIDGDYFNVVGLPVSLVWRHLREFVSQ